MLVRTLSDTFDQPKKSLSIEFFFVSDNKNLSKTDEREKKKEKEIALFDFLIFRTRLYDTTHLLNIMFAATQQIASVAGLKATKVQVRRVASNRRGDDFDTSILPTAFFFCFLKNVGVR